MSSRFQRKNRFWKICIGSRDIQQNMSKFEGLVWFVKFWHIFVNISGSDTYFSKPIFALKPWAQAGRFEYNEPYKWKNFFSDREGGSEIFNEFVRGLKISEIKKFFFPLISYTQEPKSPKERKFLLKNESFTAP